MPEEGVRTRLPGGSRAARSEAAVAPPVRRGHRGFARHEASVPRARRFAHETLTAWGATERLDDLRLCLSELATNALLHGGEGSGGFTVCLTLDGAAVLLEVHDPGAGRPVRRDPGPEDGNGRGLLLVHALADAWGVREDPAGKTVWLLFAPRDREKPITAVRGT